MRLTEEQYAALQSRTLDQVIKKHGFTPDKEKVTKYRSKKVKTDEGTFDSKWEYERWCQLKMLQRGGAVSGLQRQVPFELIPSATLDTRKLPPVRYIADFVYQKDGVQVVEDAKGGESLPDYKLKRRLMWWIHRIRVVEVRKK